MTWNPSVRRKSGLAACLLIVIAFAKTIAAAEKPPVVGDDAKDFELKALNGDSVKLTKLLADGPVVLVVLRGYPGYQCPVCSKQFGSFVEQADAFAKTKAQVVFIYPGPSDKLQERAKEFVKGRDYPRHFHMLLDPDYKFTDLYGLRWDAPKETAYPSTFVIDHDQTVTFAKVSQTHGGRAKVEDVLKAVPGK